MNFINNASVFVAASSATLAAASALGSACCGLVALVSKYALPKLGFHTTAYTTVHMINKNVLGYMLVCHNVIPYFVYAALAATIIFSITYKEDTK